MSRPASLGGVPIETRPNGRHRPTHAEHALAMVLQRVGSARTFHVKHAHRWRHRPRRRRQIVRHQPTSSPLMLLRMGPVGLGRYRHPSRSPTIGRQPGSSPASPEAQCPSRPERRRCAVNHEFARGRLSRVLQRSTERGYRGLGAGDLASRQQDLTLTAQPGAVDARSSTPAARSVEMTAPSRFKPRGRPDLPGLRQSREQLGARGAYAPRSDGHILATDTTKPPVAPSALGFAAERLAPHPEHSMFHVKHRACSVGRPERTTGWVHGSIAIAEGTPRHRATELAVAVAKGPHGLRITVSVGASTAIAPFAATVRPSPPPQIPPRRHGHPLATQYPGSRRRSRGLGEPRRAVGVETSSRATHLVRVPADPAVGRTSAASDQFCRTNSASRSTFHVVTVSPRHARTTNIRRPNGPQVSLAPGIHVRSHSVAGRVERHLHPATPGATPRRRVRRGLRGPPEQ